MKKTLSIILALLFGIPAIAFATVGLQPSYPLSSYLSGNLGGIITSTSSPTVGWITATSSTATSVFNGNVTINGVCTGCGTFGSSWNYFAGPPAWIAPTTTVGIIVSASSTIGNGGANGLTVNGNATTTGTAYFAGNVGVGTTSAFAQLSVFGGGDYASHAASSLFAIGSSTAGTATTTLFAISSAGAITTNTGFNVDTSGNISGVFRGNAINFNGGARSQIISAGDGVLRIAPANPTSFIDFTMSANGGFLVNNDVSFSRIGAGTLGVGRAIGGSNGTLVANSIGLGTTTPYAQLSILATSTTGIGAPTTLFAIASTSQGTATSTLFSVLNNGNVGIGTSTPTNMLSIGTTGSTYGSIVATENPVATSTAITIDWKKGNSQLIQLGGAATAVGFNNASTSGQTLKLMVCNPGSTAGALTFTQGIHWAGGTKPTQTSTANQCDLWSFIISQGTSTAVTSQSIYGAATLGFQ